MSHSAYSVAGRFQALIADDNLRRALGMGEMNIALHSEHGRRYAARLEHELYHSELAQRQVARRAARLAVALQVVWLEEQASRVKAELDCLTLRDRRVLSASHKFYECRLRQSLAALSERYNRIKYDMDVEKLREREEDDELWNEMQAKIGAWQQLGVIPQRHAEHSMTPSSFHQHTQDYCRAKGRARKQTEPPQLYCNNAAFHYGPEDDTQGEADAHCSFYRLDAQFAVDEGGRGGVPARCGQAPTQAQGGGTRGDTAHPVPILRPPRNRAMKAQAGDNRHAMIKSATYQPGPLAHTTDRDYHFKQVPAVAANGPPLSSTTSGFFSTENGSVSAVEKRLRVEMEKKSEQAGRHRSGVPLLSKVRRSLSAVTHRNVNSKEKRGNRLITIDDASDKCDEHNPKCMVS